MTTEFQFLLCLIYLLTSTSFINFCEYKSLPENVFLLMFQWPPQFPVQFPNNRCFSVSFCACPSLNVAHPVLPLSWRACQCNSDHCLDGLATITLIIVFMGLRVTTLIIVGLGCGLQGLQPGASISGKGAVGGLWNKFAKILIPNLILMWSSQYL